MKAVKVTTGPQFSLLDDPFFFTGSMAAAFFSGGLLRAPPPPGASHPIFPVFLRDHARQLIAQHFVILEVGMFFYFFSWFTD